MKGDSIGSDLTRRQFVAGSLVLSGLAAGTFSPADAPAVDGEYGDVELCLLRFAGFLKPMVADNPEDPSSARRRREEAEAEADFVRGLEVGDVLAVGAVTEEDRYRESGVGDTGMSSLSKLGFMEQEQVGLLDSVAAEVSQGTSVYVVVREAYYMPGIDFLRWVWFSVHAEMTPDNRERLLAIRDSEQARERRIELEDDMYGQRLIEALASGGPLPPP